MDNNENNNLNMEQETTVVENINDESVVPVEQVSEVNQETPSPVVEETVSSQEEKKTGLTKKKKIIITICLLVIGALICCYLLFFNNKEEENTVYNDSPVVAEENEEEVEPEETQEETPTPAATEKADYSDYYDEGDTNFKKQYNNPVSPLDFRFLQLENNGKDKVYSPISIKYALAMLSDASRGESKRQIDAVLGNYKANKYPTNKKMSFANAMFINNRFKDSVKKNYTDLLKDKYAAEILYDSFASPDAVNEWVSKKTHKMIDKLMKDDEDISIYDFFLINALTIDLYWNQPIHAASGSKIPSRGMDDIYDISYKHEKIDAKANESYRGLSYPYIAPDEFPKIKFDGKTKVPTSEVLADFNRYDIVKDLGEKKIKDTVRPEYKKYLAGNKKKVSDQEIEKELDTFVKDLKENYGKGKSNTDFYIYEDSNVKTFAKDLKKYNNMTLQYVGIMPKTKSLNDYVKSLSINDIKEITGKMKDMKIENFKEGYATVIRGNIPFFKTEYDLKFMEDLKKIGIKDVFDKKAADLSGLTGSKDEYINKALHKANIEFSNDGIKAAAVTAFGGLGAASGGFDYQFKIPVIKIDVTFNKPYMYIVRDKESGEIWFAGTVYNPITKLKEKD